MNRDDLKWLIELAISKMMTDDCEYNDPPSQESIDRLLAIVKTGGFELHDFRWLNNVVSKPQFTRDAKPTCPFPVTKNGVRLET
jgi:hypothetical protein